MTVKSDKAEKKDAQQDALNKLPIPRINPEQVAKADKALEKVTEKAEAVPGDNPVPQGPIKQAKVASLIAEEIKATWGAERAVGVTIDNMALVPLLRDFDPSLSEQSEAKLKSVGLPNLHWRIGADIGLCDVYRYTKDGNVFTFLVDKDSFWVGTSEDLGGAFPIYVDHQDFRDHRSRRFEMSTVIILNSSQCTNCFVTGSNLTLKQVNAKECAFKDATITNSTPYAAALSKLAVIDSRILDSSIGVSGSIVESYLEKVQIDKGDRAAIAKSIIEGTHLRCSNGTITTRCISLKAASVIAKDSLVLKNVRYPKGLNVQVDKVFVVNPYDITTIDVLNYTFHLVRKSVDSVNLTLGHQASEFNFKEANVDVNPWSCGSQPEVRDIIKKMVVKADQNDYEGIATTRNWESEFNRRFLDYASRAVISRMDLIKILQDAADAIQMTGGAAIPVHRENYY